MKVFQFLLFKKFSNICPLSIIYVEYAGDELDRIIPPTSRRQGAREKKKESVLEKIRKIVEVFVGI